MSAPTPEQLAQLAAAVMAQVELGVKWALFRERIEIAEILNLAQQPLLAAKVLARIERDEKNGGRLHPNSRPPTAVHPARGDT
jgi:hypothetical protein